MFRTSIQQEIISFLDCKDLVLVCQVNRSFNQLTKASSIWQQQAIQLFGSESQFPVQEIPSIDWKQECLNGLSLHRTWQQASGEILTGEELEFFYSEIIRSLTRPEFVLPPFRREINSFPTCIQDILGNPCEIEYSEYSEGFRQILKTNYSHIKHELQYYSEVNKLRNKLLRKDYRDSITTNDSKSLYQPISFALKFLTSLEETVSISCRISAHVLGNTESSLLEEYLFKWEQFSNSVSYINSLLTPFAETVSEVLGRPVSLVQFLLGIWRTEVYDKVLYRLTDVFRKVLEEERGNILSAGNFSYENISLLQAFVQSMCDLSLDEDSVYFKNHSKLVLRSAIKDFHNLIVRESHYFYNNLALSGLELVRFLEIEQNMLESFALRVTCEQLIEIKNQGLQVHLFGILENMYFEFDLQTNEYQNQRCSLNNHWVHDMTKKYGNPEKVHAFLLASADQAAKIIRKYNQITTYKNDEVNDFSIERIASHIGLSFEAIGQINEDKV